MLDSLIPLLIFLLACPLIGYPVLDGDTGALSLHPLSIWSSPLSTSQRQKDVFPVTRLGLTSSLACWDPLRSQEQRGEA